MSKKQKFIYLFNIVSGFIVAGLWVHLSIKRGEPMFLLTSIIFVFMAVYHIVLFFKYRKTGLPEKLESPFSDNSVVHFEELFASYPAEDLRNILESDRYLPNARQAAANLLHMS